MKNISITKNELRFLIEQTKMEVFKLTLSERQIDDMKDELAKLLQQIGLDKDYELTEHGQIIENLIDKLDN